MSYFDYLRNELQSRNQCCYIQNGYWTNLECSFFIWYNSGSIGNLKIIPILAGLMIAHRKFKQNKKYPEQSYTNHILIFPTCICCKLICKKFHFCFFHGQTFFGDWVIFLGYLSRYTINMVINTLNQCTWKYYANYPCKITSSPINNTYKVKYANYLIMYWKFYVFIVGIVGCVHILCIVFQVIVHKCLIVKWCFSKKNILHFDYSYYYY